MDSPLATLSTNKRKRPSDTEDELTKKLSRRADGKGGGKLERPLQVVTDVSTLGLVQSPTVDELLSVTDSDADSLFDEPPLRLSTPEVEDIRNVLNSRPQPDPGSLPHSTDPSNILARRTAPPIPGLFFDPTILLPEAYGEDLMWTCIRAFFPEGTANQVMLFERSSPPSAADPASSSGTCAPSGLPSFLSNLLSLLRDLLRPAVPPETYDLLFSPSPAGHGGPPRARQAIINLYWPGEGITPHVDLLDRYGDGIIGVSLGSGCAMNFAKADAPSPSSDAHGAPRDENQEKGEESGCALFLPKGSVLVMTKEARYEWTHGIEKRFEDLIEEVPGSERGMVLERNVRLSVTFRWLLPGADVVGTASSVQTDTR